MSTDPQFDLLKQTVAVSRFDLPAKLECVAPVREQFMEFLEAMELPADEASGWKLTFTELVNNAIVHGAGENPQLHIGVEWSLQANSIVLGIEQPGNGPPEPLSKRKDLSPDLLLESGRGVFLALSFLDSLDEWRGEAAYRVEARKVCSGIVMEPPSSEMNAILTELSASYEGLAAFYQLSESLVKSDSLSEFLGQSLKNVRDSALMDYLQILPDSDLPPFVGTHLGDLGVYAEVTGPLSELLARKSEIIWENERQRSTMGIDGSSFGEYASGCLLPITAESQFFGHLAACRKAKDNPIASSQVNNLRTIADIFGISIANFISTQIRREAEKDLREFEIAADIQQHLLPVRQPTESTSREVRVFQRVAQNVAGDFAEYCQDRLGNHYVTIIDVMGKGVSAALLGIIYRTAFNLQMDDPKPLPVMLKRIGRILHRMLGDLTMFITVTILRWNDHDRLIEQVNAGHCPTIKQGADGSIKQWEPSGPPIGLMAAFDYQCDQILMEPGDRIVLVSDGCYEWRYNEGLFGWDRMIRMIETSNHQQGSSLWHELCKVMDQASDDDALSDDITMVFVKEIQ